MYSLPALLKPEGCLVWHLNLSMGADIKPQQKGYIFLLGRNLTTAKRD